MRRIAAQISMCPQLPDAHHNIGIALAESRKPEQAIAAFRQAIALRPGYAEALHRLGILLRETDQHEEAIDALQQAVRYRPGFPDAFNDLGIALRKVNRNDQAVAAFRQAIALSPPITPWLITTSPCRCFRQPQERIRRIRMAMASQGLAALSPAVCSAMVGRL